MLNNFKLIKGILKFPRPDSFYFIQVIQRRKDIPTLKTERSVKRTYTVSSLEDFEKVESSITSLCEHYKARAYIHPVPRAWKSIALRMLSNIAERIEKDEYNNLDNVFPSCAGKYSMGDPLWIVDLDKRDNDFREYISKIKSFINKVRGAEGDRVVLEVPTPNGLHLITKPFDLLSFNDVCYENGVSAPDIHKNNPTILFTPESLSETCKEEDPSPRIVNQPLNKIMRLRDRYFKNERTEELNVGFRILYNNDINVEITLEGDNLYVDFCGSKYKFPPQMNIMIDLFNVSLESEFVRRFNKVAEIIGIPSIEVIDNPNLFYDEAIREMVLYYLGSDNNEGVYEGSSNIIWKGHPLRDLYDLPNIYLTIEVFGRNICIKYGESDKSEEFQNTVNIFYESGMEEKFVEALRNFFDKYTSKYLRKPMKIICHDVLRLEFFK